MPRIDRRRLRTGLRLGLPDDPVSSRGFVTAMKVQLAGATAVLLGTSIVPHVSRDDRLALFVLLGTLVASLTILTVTLGRRNPRLGWSIATVLELVTIFVGAFVVPDAYVPALLAYTIVVAATTAIGGLGIGLVVSGIAAAAAVAGTLVAPGQPAEIALTCGLAMIAYPTIALSIDGFTLSRHRAATQLARLHETLRSVSAEPSLTATLDSLVDAVVGAFRADSAAVLLREGDHLRLAASRPPPSALWDSGRIARSSARELESIDFSPLSYALAHQQTVTVKDVATEDRFPDWARWWRRNVNERGLVSMVFVPLRRGSESIGMLHVCFSRPGALADDELALLETYAEQATMVIMRAQAFAELEAADALKSEFLATVSHELRTPLTAAKGFVDTVLLHWDRLEDAQRRQLLQRASGNADELARLIDQLLESSRLDAGTVRVLPVDTELAPLVDGVVSRMAPLLEDHLVVVEADDQVRVEVDADAFAHVLANLLTNAARFSAADSMIRIVAGAESDRAVISVHDDGIGIATDEHHRIFERFYRVGDDSGSGRGTGIGLAIAARFVALLGGDIWVESTPGKGSTFSFSVPLAATRARGRAEVVPTSAQE